MPRFPKLIDIVNLVQTLEQNPFGALILLLLVLSVGLVVWVVK